MPRISHKISTFNGGEYAPEFHGRTDLDKHRAGARRIENFIVHPEGGAHRRSGSRFVKAAIDSTKKSRLIPFVFSTEQAYMLEFSEFLIRVFANELQVDAAERAVVIAVSTITDEFNFFDHGYVNDQGPFRITATGGIPTPLVEDTTDYWMSMPNTMTFDESDIDAVNDKITMTGHGYVTEMGPFHMTTDEAMEENIQSITPLYVERIDDDTVKLRLTAGGATIDLIGLAGNPGNMTFAPSGDYLRDKFRLSATQGGAPIVITAAGTAPHTFTPNPAGTPASLPQEIPTPFTEAQLYELHFVQNADFLFIDHKDHRPIQLTRSSNTQWALDFVNIVDGPYGNENLDTSDTLAVTGTAIGDDARVTISFPTSINGGLGWLAQDVGRLVRLKRGTNWGVVEIDSILASTVADGTVVQAIGSAGSTSAWRLGSWYTGNWPSSISFFEQRLAHAGEPDTPQTIHGSKISLINVFGPTELNGDVVATDAIDFKIAMNQVNAVRWLAVGNRLIAGTSNSLFTARASFDGEAITPTNIQVQRITAVGALAVQPVNVADQLVYITANSQGLRGFSLASDADVVIPDDLLKLAKHILGRTKTVTTMAFQQDRQQLIWLTRSDGVVVAVTYVPEEQVSAGHRHIIGGNFGSKGTAQTFLAAAVTVAPDEITIALHGYTEGQGPFRLTTSDTLPAGTAVATNYYIQVVNENTIKLRVTPDGSVVDLTDQGVGTHTITESGDAVVESVAVIPAPDGTHDQVWISVKRTIGAATARHIEFFEDEWLDDVTTSMRYVDSASVAYSGVAVSTITEGLDHLEGETVQVLANGAVHPDRVVSSGEITLDDDVYTDVLVGLGYVSELETLDLEFPDPEGSSMGKIARIDHLVLRLYNSLGGKIGPDTAHLTPIQYRDFGDAMDAAPPVFSGDRKISYDGPYQRQKRIVFRQDQPLPLNILSVNVMAKTASR